MARFVAIDFETADQGADSACAVGLVRVEDGAITRRELFWIRPPRQQFMFTYIHGITWKKVESAPDFAGVWPRMREMLEGVDFVAAHNASFDRRVLKSCADAHGIDLPEMKFICTVQLARDAWSIRPTRLPNVCEHLGITLNHHEALSDAEACARIVMNAMHEGIEI